MSVGHSDPFELGVHWRTHEPLAAQNVSAQPGWSGHTEVHAIVHVPGDSAVAPLHDSPALQSPPLVQ